MRIRLVCLLWALFGVFITPARAGTIFYLDSMLGTQIASFSFPDFNNPSVTDTAILTGGALMRVDGVGDRVLVSDFGNPGQGPVSSGYLAAVAAAPAGFFGLEQTLLVVDTLGGTNGEGALLAVNPATGQRTLLSDFGNSEQGPMGVTPMGVVVSNELAGRGTDIYVVDSAAGTNNTGAIFQVDPTTGNRKLFSDFGNGAQGPGVDPTSITIAPVDLRGAGAKLLVLDSNGGTNSVGTILEVDGNGNRTVVSDLGNPAQGEPAVSPQQIVNGGGLPGLDHVLYLTDNLATDSSGTGVVFGIDLANGHRSIVNSFSKSDQAVSPLNLTGITLNEEGDLVVINDQSASATESSDVFRLSPSNGRLTVVTNCGNSAFGPCIRPIAITQAP